MIKISHNLIHDTFIILLQINLIVCASKEHPEYIGHFYWNFFINKKIPVKIDQYIQGTPWQKAVE